jgi:hypothetical protein
VAELAKIHLDALNQRIGGATGLQSALQNEVGRPAASRQQCWCEAEPSAISLPSTSQLIQLRQNAIDAAQAMLAMTDEQLASIGQTRAGLEAFILEQKQAQQQTVLMGRQFLHDRQADQRDARRRLGVGHGEFPDDGRSGKNVFKSLGIAAAQTAANVLKSLGEMILKQALFNALSAHSQSGGGGIGGQHRIGRGALFPASLLRHDADRHSAALLSAGRPPAALARTVGAWRALTAGGGTLAVGGRMGCHRGGDPGCRDDVDDREHGIRGGGPHRRHCGLPDDAPQRQPARVRRSHALPHAAAWPDCGRTKCRRSSSAARRC